LILDAGKISYDAPYACGITSPDHARAIVEAAALVDGWTPQTRRLVEIYVIDRGKLALARAVSLSREWWQAFAGSIADAPESLDRAAYERAVAQQQARMTTAQMLQRAAAAEAGGAV
jgi:hypothetical protein